MRSISRRQFLKLAALSLGGLALRPLGRLFTLPEFPAAERLVRVTRRLDVYSRPDLESPTTSVLYEDAVLPALGEVVGQHPFTNQRWTETPQGYIWSPYLQAVGNRPNGVLTDLPQSSRGPGMWCEVTVPYVDMILDNPPARSPSFQDLIEAGLPLRLYYSQVVWVDALKTDAGGQTWYRINEPFGTYGDILWGAAEAFRPLTADEIAPIHPDVTDKRVVVDTTYQTMACYEGSAEVFFTRISSGAKWDAWGNVVDAYATPTGAYPIWRKLISLHMAGGTTGGGWDLPGVGWTTLFVGTGIAIHSTFWHNNYGEPMSRGCVNARPEDAKWVWRWTLPVVPFDPGDATVQMPGGTTIEVVES